jgi:hypothetical protein
MINSNNDNRIFISEGYEDIVDIDNLSKESIPEELLMFMDNEKSTVLSFKETYLRYVLTFVSSNKTLQKIILKQIEHVLLKVNNKVVFDLLYKDNLIKLKIKYLSKNSYRIKLYFKKEEGK